MARARKPDGRKSQKRLARRVNNRPLRQRFLIVCEGTQTEPRYFERFRVPADVKVVGVAENTVNLVREAVRLKDEADAYDQVWCVFDRDSFPVTNFNNALTLARKNDIKVAYSNEAFELWYLLHFDFHNSPIARESYMARLSARLGFEYAKNNRDMYELLESKQDTAIRHATNLLAQYGDQHQPAHDNPCTTVHWLVQALNEVAV